MAEVRQQTQINVEKYQISKIQTKIIYNNNNKYKIHKIQYY